MSAKKISSIFIPYYTCEAVLEPLKKLGVEYEYYKIGSDFEIVDLPQYLDNSILLYTNYFGIKNKYIDNLLNNNNQNIIIDNSQAFYASYKNNLASFYSPRKFFGVPDGGYLYFSGICDFELEQDVSFQRFDHLLRRIDESPEKGYPSFVENDLSLSNQPMKEMSKLTQKLLKSIDYERIKLIRERNFLYLHDNLKEFNELKIDLDEIEGPMIYPFLVNNDKLREVLIKNRVYIATYWKNIFDWCEPDSQEWYFAKYLIPLPIDQRYNLEDMNDIITILKKTIE